MGMEAGRAWGSAGLGRPHQESAERTVRAIRSLVTRSHTQSGLCFLQGKVREWNTLASNGLFKSNTP